jgi:hypothetical protein
MRPTVPPATQTLVLPIAVNVADFTAAYTAHTKYDLFHPPTTPIDDPVTLDYTDPSTLPSPGATDYETDEANLQYWSDGQHGNGALSSSAVVAILGDPLTASIAAGLLDNIRRQNLGYALVTVPIWDGQPSDDTVQIVGFARMKIVATDISSTVARGTFVPYVNGAFGVPTTPGVDLGAAFIGMTS